MKTLLAAAILTGAWALGAPSAHAERIDCRLLAVRSAIKLPEKIYLEVPGLNVTKRIVPGSNLGVEPLSLTVSSGSILRVKDGEGADARVMGEVEVKAGVSEIFLFMVPAGDGGKTVVEDGKASGLEPEKAESPGQPDVKPEEKAAWKCVAADASPKELSHGGVALINGTEGKARITLGGATESVEASGSLFLTEPPAKDEFNMAPVKVECEIGDRWRGVSEGATRFTGNMVYWLVVYDMPLAHRPKVQFFKQTVGTE